MCWTMEKRLYTFCLLKKEKDPRLLRFHVLIQVCHQISMSQPETLVFNQYSHQKFSILTHVKFLDIVSRTIHP